MSTEREQEKGPDNPFTKGVPAVRQTATGEAMASREIAQIQAALVIARRFPRDQMKAMDLILMDCTLPALAEAATYDYKRGGTDIAAPSIRLAEAVARRWGNIQCGVMEISRDEGSSECKAYAWDLETGYYEERVFQVPHWRDTRDGGHPLKDERDIYELVANMGARRKRACILAVIPMDVIDRAAHACEVTLRNKIQITDEYLAILLEKLAEFGVTKEMVEKRIQRRYAKDTVTPGIALQLQKIYNSLFDKASSVADWFKADRAPIEEQKMTKRGRKRPEPKKDEKDPPPKDELSAEATKISDASQLEFVRKKAKAGDISDADICKAFGLAKLEDLRAAVVPAVLNWLNNPAEPPK